jgi:hypothetical protein
MRPWQKIPYFVNHTVIELKQSPGYVGAKIKIGIASLRLAGQNFSTRAFLGSYCSILNILCDDDRQLTVFSTPLFPKFKTRGVFNSFP